MIFDISQLSNMVRIFERMPMNRAIKISAFVISMFLFSPFVWACAVPVFQYALAYWTADAYEAIVFHQGPLSSDEQAVLDRLKEASWDAEIHANIAVRTVDLADSPGTVMQKLWESQSSSELPWMMIKYPRISGIAEDIWSGGLTDMNVEALLDSPVRKEIGRRILKGEVAVWVFLESGDQQKDEAAVSLLESQLKKMSDELRIIVPEEGDEQFDEADLRVSFSIMRLSRSDPDEKLFIQMLLKSEWDLQALSKPMAFPIFGRGRALYALVGDGIRENNIEMACSFLVGWCSCEIKDQNPGVDMLMSVNWDSMIDDKLYNQTTKILNSTREAEAKGGSGNAMRRNIFIVLLLQALIVVTLGVVILWRKRQRA